MSLGEGFLANSHVLLDGIPLEGTVTVTVTVGPVARKLAWPCRAASSSRG